MEFVTREVIFDINGRMKKLVGYFYEGPVDRAKKGREIVEQAGKNSLNNATTAANIANSDQAYRTSQAKKGDAFADQLTPGSNGALSPYAKAQYNQSLRQNAAGANNFRQQGLAAISRRGFGSVPIGAGSSITNSANQAENAADTDAYTNAQNTTMGGGLEALKYRQGQEGLFDPTKDLNSATGANNSATESGVARSKMGSTFGDIMGGIGQVGKIAAGFMVPGGFGTKLTSGLSSFGKG